MNVNNTIYETYGDQWWNEDASFDFTSLRYCVNPVRYGYFARVLHSRRPPGTRVLDVGCGGGFLSESFARDGFEVSGVDPAERSIEAARRHAIASGLSISYRAGRGEALPFADASFDVVACCDVLEHVDDVDAVVGEVARVLVPGGIFFFDTVNRTLKSRFALITVWQGLDLGGIREPGVHVWEKFITPAELASHLGRHGFAVGDMRGMAARKNPLAMAWAFRRIRRGEIRNEALAPALGLRESSSLAVSYMGFAVAAPRH